MGSMIDLRSPLTWRNAFGFPLQSWESRRDVLVGGAVLFIPVLGFVLNMGYRLRMVHRMQRGECPWPGWADFRGLLRHGGVATAAIFGYHLPALICLSLAWWWANFWLGGLGLALGALATFFLPGFMTFYAYDFDVRHVLRPLVAWGRVLRGGRFYLRAWGIGICACLLSFGGLLLFGVGFAWTSVWFWQVAAFCFSRVFSEQYGLLGGDAVQAGLECLGEAQA
jgi:hypothetical protein